MTFAEAKAQADALDARATETGATLRALSGGGVMNMTPDHVRASPEWQAARAAYDRAFAQLRAFNAVYVKRFAREIRADRDARRSAKTNDLQTPS